MTWNNLNFREKSGAGPGSVRIEVGTKSSSKDSGSTLGWGAQGSKFRICFHPVSAQTFQIATSSKIFRCLALCWIYTCDGPNRFDS